MNSETFQKIVFFGLALWIAYFLFIKNPKN